MSCWDYWDDRRADKRMVQKEKTEGKEKLMTSGSKIDILD